MHFAKKLKDMIPERNLRYMLHDFLTGYKPARSLKRVHASELTKAEGFCPRYYALHDVSEIFRKDEWLSTSEVVTFDIGNSLQSKVVHWFADMGKAIGHWKCVACGTLHEFTPRPDACKECGTRVFHDVEVRFKSAVTDASCGVDLLLNVGALKLLPVEIKTMDKEVFKDLKAPLAEHRWRTNLYLRIIEESGHPWSNLVQTGKGVILYISKGGYGVKDMKLKKWGLPDSFSPFKDYEVTRADDQTDSLVRRAKVVKDFRAGTKGMPCGICATALDKRARYCDAKKACFSGDFPPEYDWTKDE